MYKLLVHSGRKRASCPKIDLNYSALISLLGLLLWMNGVICELDHHREGPIQDRKYSRPASRSDQVEFSVPSEPHHVIRKRSADQPLRVYLHYDASIKKLDEDKIGILNNSVFPEALSFWQRALKVRRTVDRILLNRNCLNGISFSSENDYCKLSCEAKTKCGEVEVPEEHLDACRACDENGDNCNVLPNSTAGVGILNYDFVLYVSAIQTGSCGGRTIYSTRHCQQEPFLDRPIAGYVNLCPNKLNETLEQLILNLKIQLVHPLAFTRTLFPYFRDDDGKPLTGRDTYGRPRYDKQLQRREWSNRTVRTVKRTDWRVSSGRITREVEMIVTPRVVKEVRRHFNCSDLEGAELEDQEALAQWEKRVFGNEAMTVIDNTKQPFSRITFALLEDTGWYRANYNMTEELHWGRNLGCNFVKKSCMDWMITHKGLSPFCNKIKTSPVSQFHCTYDHSSVGVCNLSKFLNPLPAKYRIFGVVPNRTENDCNVTREDLPHYGGSTISADYCPYVEKINLGSRDTICYNAENNPDPDDNVALEEYGHRSKCFYHTNSKWKRVSSKTRSTAGTFGSGCYNYSCDNGILRIFVNNVSFTCEQAGQELKIEVTVGEWTHHGGIKCPSFEKICGD